MRFLSLFFFFFVNLVPFWSAKLKEQRLMFGECPMVSIVATESVKCVVKENVPLKDFMFLCIYFT